ncbi:hypothetical protein J6590_006451 [Homalodisca vitripennis]|nr:hypothetical protein J6590_006451 [Homalodisca vitripennis]
MERNRKRKGPLTADPRQLPVIVMAVITGNYYQKPRESICLNVDGTKSTSCEHLGVACPLVSLLIHSQRPLEYAISNRCTSNCRKSRSSSYVADTPNIVYRNRREQRSVRSAAAGEVSHYKN